MKYPESLKYIIIWLGILLILVSLPARADILIVAQGPMTGQDATTGEQMERGAKAAVQAINDAGGVLGQKLKLSIKDDACDPKQAVAVANEVSSEKAVAVLGPTCSSAAIPASKVYGEEGIVMLTPSATNPLLTEQGLTNVFRACGRDDQQGQAAADYIAAHFKGKAVAVVDDKTAYGHGLADEVRKDLHKAGIKEKLYETINRGERDYGSLVTKLKQNNVDVLFYGGYHTEAALIIRQMRTQGMNTVLVGGDDMATYELWSITKEAGEGTILSFVPDPRAKPEAADAVKRLRASGYEPEGLSLYSYASIQVLVEAMKRAGAADPVKMAAVMHGGTYATVIGDLSFDAKGDITHPDFIMYRWHNGNYEPLAK